MLGRRLGILQREGPRDTLRGRETDGELVIVLGKGQHREGEVVRSGRLVHVDRDDVLVRGLEGVFPGAGKVDGVGTGQGLVPGDELEFGQADGLAGALHLDLEGGEIRIEVQVHLVALDTRAFFGDGRHIGVLHVSFLAEYLLVRDTVHGRKLSGQRAGGLVRFIRGGGGVNRVEGMVAGVAPGEAVGLDVAEFGDAVVIVHIVGDLIVGPMLGAAMDKVAGGFRAVNADLVAGVFTFGLDPVDGLDGLSVHFLVRAVHGAGFGLRVDSENDCLSGLMAGEYTLLVATGDQQDGSCKERKGCGVSHKANLPIGG